MIEKINLIAPLQINDLEGELIKSKKINLYNLVSKRSALYDQIYNVFTILYLGQINFSIQKDNNLETK